MSDFRRCSSADSKSKRKKLQKFIHGIRAHRQKCFETLAPIQVLAMLIYHFELQILPKVFKTVGILAITHKNVF
jgi:hypothetical protein